MRKRTIIIAALLLAAGAVVNVAVAWVACLWAPLKVDWTPYVATDDQLELLLKSGWSRPETGVIENEECRGIGVTYSSIERQPGTGRSLGRDLYGVICSAGFPVPSLRGALVNENAIKYPSTFGRRLVAIDPATRLPDVTNPIRVHALFPPESKALHISRNGRFLPCVPVWPGFAINTVFFAFVLWLLFAAPSALRRLRGGRRIKLGLCPKCAYPVGPNEVCTECGAAVVKQKAETQKAEIA